MILHLRSLAFLIIANSLARAAPPVMFTLSGSAPNVPGARVSAARYFDDNIYLQAGLEEGVSRLDSHWASLSQGLIGIGWEMESTSHLFFRTTGMGGVSAIFKPGDTQSKHSDWMQTIRIAPEVVWYPYGRFSGASMGFSAGVHLEFRSSLTQRPLPGNLEGTNTQFFAGLVL